MRARVMGELIIKTPSWCFDWSAGGRAPVASAFDVENGLLDVLLFQSSGELLIILAVQQWFLKDRLSVVQLTPPVHPFKVTSSFGLGWSRLGNQQCLHTSTALLRSCALDTYRSARYAQPYRNVKGPQDMKRSPLGSQSPEK